MIIGGSLVLDASTTIPLMAEPAPNTTFTGVDNRAGGSGDNFTVILNEQIVSVGGNDLTVNGVHIILEGPRTTGHIIIGQSHCDVAVVVGTTSTLPGENTTSSSMTSSSTSSSSSSSTSTTTTTTAVADPLADQDLRPRPGGAGGGGELRGHGGQRRALDGSERVGDRRPAPGHEPGGHAVR